MKIKAFVYYLIFFTLFISAMSVICITVAGNARCQERGILLSGIPWRWAGGNSCEIPSSDIKIKEVPLNRKIRGTT